MSRKRGKKPKVAEAVPDDILAEGSGPVGLPAIDGIATVEDVGTTDDIATTQDVVTADEVVSTAHIDADAETDADADALGDDAEMAELSADDPADLEAMAAAASGDEPADGGAGEPTEGEGEGEGEVEVDDAAVFPTSAAGMDAAQLKHLVEALIFASDRPLTVQRLRQLTRVSDVRRLEQALADLAEDYRDRGLILQQVSGGYQFRTRTQFSAWVQQLIAGRPVRLSRAQLETLAIIAYRQPITRPEIDDIRGVDSTATLKLLMDRMLIRALGKREEVGRPTLYGTTKEFLDFFSLGDLRELPTLREYSELTAESRKVMSERLGVAADAADLAGAPTGSPITEPADAAGEPADAAGEPADAAGEPADAAGESADAAGEPIMAAEPPAESATE